MKRRKNPLTLREVGSVVGLLLVIVWLSLLVLSIFKKEQIARTTVAQTKSELAALDARKKTLFDTVTTLDTERGQEASLRETFGVARPGEEVIVIVPKKELPPPPPLTFWEKVKVFLHF